MKLARKDLKEVMLPYYVYGWRTSTARKIAALLISRVLDISIDEARTHILGKVVPTDCNASFVFFVRTICDGIAKEPEEQTRISPLMLYASKVIGHKHSIFVLNTAGS